VICDADFPPSEGGLVAFARTSEDDAWHARMAATNGVGHPPEQAWFCGVHLAQAQALSTSTLSEALAAMRRPKPGPLSAAVEVAIAGRTVLVLFEELRSLLPELAAAVGVPELPEMPVRTHRDWTPMDGVQPPWCPFSDHGRVEHRGDGVEARVSWSRASWTADEVANVSAELWVRGPGGRLSLRAHEQGDPAITQLRVRASGVDLSAIRSLLDLLG
jgi:hypothetical protein